jgi:hypothetical protein
MTTTYAPRKTIEEKKAQAEALHNSIAEQVEQLRNTDQWVKFLTFAQSFHAYSLNNLFLILAQSPEATAVAGFRAWQARGRQVRKGESGIRIFGYSTKKITDEDAEGNEVEKKVARFPILSVFDIGQTDPIDGAEDAPSITTQLTGTNDYGVVATLSEHLTREGWAIERRALPGIKNGYTEPKGRLVVLDVDLSPEHAAKTMIHEAAHIELAHIEDPAEYLEHRGLMETEAESVAYIVAGLLGFDTAAYSIGYIAGWSKGDTELIKSTASRVLRAAHTIAGTLCPDPEPVED